MKKELLLSAAIGLGLTAVSSNVEAANGHGCGAQAKKDNDPNEWVYVPKGVCEKITGGIVLASKKIK